MKRSCSAPRICGWLFAESLLRTDHPLQAGFLDGSDKALGVRIVAGQQLQAVKVNPLVDSASPTRFILW